MIKILLASNNSHKLNEISSFFKDEIKFIMPTELGIFELAEEDKDNFLENAKMKVEHFPDNIDYPILGDDSGLVVNRICDFVVNLKKNRIKKKEDYLEKTIKFLSNFGDSEIASKINKFWNDYFEKLDIFPGVVSKRFGYIEDEKVRNQYLIWLLKRLDEYSNKKIKEDNFWPAYFETSLALRYKGKILHFSGIAKGYIIDKPSGDNGFGYDPIFFYPPLNKTFAQLNLEEKNRVSHRSRALLKLARYLKFKK